MLLKLERFQYDTPLDLNMRYYHIRLIKYTHNLCKVILPCVKYHYKHLPTGVANLPDTFQHMINDSFMDYNLSVRAYITF